MLVSLASTGRRLGIKSCNGVFHWIQLVERLGITNFGDGCFGFYCLKLRIASCVGTFIDFFGLELRITSSSASKQTHPIPASDSSVRI